MRKAEFMNIIGEKYATGECKYLKVTVELLYIDIICFSYNVLYIHADSYASSSFYELRFSLLIAIYSTIEI